MRCYARVPLEKTGGFRETYCYEQLRDDGTCRSHGQQACVKPEWMSEEEFKAASSNLQLQVVAVRKP